MRLNNNGGIVEIESWVDFASNYDSDVEQLIDPSHLSIKGESKESIYELSTKNREISRCLKTRLWTLNAFWIQKIFRWNAFKNWRAEQASFSISFISKIELYFFSHLPKYQNQAW